MESRALVLAWTLDTTHGAYYFLNSRWNILLILIPKRINSTNVQDYLFLRIELKIQKIMLLPPTTTSQNKWDGARAVLLFFIHFVDHLFENNRIIMDGNDSSTNTSNIPQITKTIYLIRHGVAVHNVHDPNTNERPNYFDPALTDPPLIRQGEVQASVLGENMKRMGLAAANSNNDDGMDIDNQHQAIQSPPPPIELVVCSPLTRCLQTASRIFPTYFQSSPPSQHDSMSEAISEDGDAQPFVLSEDCKVCCHGDVREAFGKHYPDRRR